MTTPNSTSSKTPPMPSTTVVSTASIAVTAALVWLIQTYILHSNLPGPVTVAIYAVVPAAVGGFFTRHALNQMPPNLDKAIAARWDKKFHAQQGTRVVPTDSIVGLPIRNEPPMYRSNLGYSQPPVTAENPTGKDDNPYTGTDTSKEESL